MKKTVLLILMSLLAVLPLAAQDRLAEIEEQLRQAPVQEKIYVHMDNTCYFKGDTIWYKAYIVRADDLTYTDMSRITYVELLSPDGMMVERQMLVTSPKGWTAGNFVLQDSLYSGWPTTSSATTARCTAVCSPSTSVPQRRGATRRSTW